MGRLYDLVQQHIDRQPYPPSQRDVALRLDVPPQTLGNWRKPRSLPDKDALVRLADLVGVPYEVVRDAVLEDIGYLHREQQAVMPRARRGGSVTKLPSRREGMQEIQETAAQSEPRTD